ncbi:MAG: DUF3021 family protein [Clostridia bacterium]|nr:DUF3021 family protein [Clostridia bacterium]
MKKYLKSFYSALKNACTAFTFIMFAVYFIAAILGRESITFPTNAITWVFLVSIWFAISNLVFEIKKLDLIVRTVLHFIAYTIGFYFVMHFLEEFNKKNNNINSSNAFVATIVFATLYIIVALAVFLILHFINRKKNEEEDYTPAFDKKKNDDKDEKSKSKK